MDQLRIYVAGPYTPSNCDLHDASRIANANVNKAITIANALFKKGHYAFIPHLSHYTHIHESNHCKAPKEFWYEYDNTFLEKWANAIFYISSSHGADMELALAKKLGYPVYLFLDDVPDLNRCKFLVDKSEGVFDRWQECSKGIDLAQYGECSNCLAYERLNNNNESVSKIEV